jgi:tripartite-type tricarboxylate transporter receptor subunit TctC
MGENMKITKTITSALAALSLLLGSQSLAAEKFPTKPIEMTVLFGGTAKTVGQLVAQGLESNLATPVVPVSRPGGGGAVGYKYIQSKAASGYDIVWNSNSVSTTYHGGMVPFDYKAFDPIAALSVEVPVLAVKAGTFKDVKALADYAKKNPGKLKVGISGKGSFTHLTSAIIFDAMGVKVNYISYGSGKAPTELLAGRIDAAVQWPGQFRSFDKAGQLKVLAATSPKRIASDPNVPTMQELGYKNVDVTMWRGIAAKKGTPKDQIQAIEAAAAKVATSPSFVAASKKIGFEINYLDSKAFAKKIADDDRQIGKLMKDLGLKKK